MGFKRIVSKLNRHDKELLDVRVGLSTQVELKYALMFDKRSLTPQDHNKPARKIFRRQQTEERR